MSHELRFSVLISPNVPWIEFVRRCRHVEELGFDGSASPTISLTIEVREEQGGLGLRCGRSCPL